MNQADDVGRLAGDADHRDADLCKPVRWDLDLFLLRLVAGRRNVEDELARSEPREFEATLLVRLGRRNGRDLDERSRDWEKFLRDEDPTDAPQALRQPAGARGHSRVRITTCPVRSYCQASGRCLGLLRA